MAVNGQLWYLSQGSNADARLAFINSDKTGATTLLQNDGALPEPLGGAFPQDIAIDSAAGLYYILNNGGNGDTATLLMGHIGSSAAPTVIQTFPADDLVNAILIDPTTNRLYVSYTDVDLNNSLQGVIQFNYNPTTGAAVPMNGTINNSFIVTQATANIQSSVASGVDVMAPRDFDLDLSTNTLYFTQLTLGDGFESNLIWKIDLDNPTAAATPVLQQSQFALDGNGSDFVTANGFIIDVEVDSSHGLVYFTTQEEEPGGGNTAQNAIWYISTSANGSTAATKVTLSGVNTANFYPGDMQLDEVNRILYVESEQGVDSSGSDDAILVFQLNGAGTSATLIDTISPTFTENYTNLSGMIFDSLASLSLSASSAHAVEQTNYTLLIADPTITDVDGNHLASATVKTSGSFAGSGDQLSVAGVTSGTISGTNIVVSISTDGSGNQTMTLTGYDTIAHYEQVLGDIRFVANSNNPTNSGSNTTRTITWQVNDGASGNPVGQNTGQNTITIDTVNDAPVMAGDLGATVLEGGSYTLTSSDINYSDPDDTSSGVTFTVSNLSHGTLTVNGVSQTSFTYSQLIGGLVVFTHDGGETSSASFSISVEDGNEDNSTPSNSTFSLAVTAVNDAPVLTGDLAASMNNGASYVLTTTDLNFTDIDDTASGVTFTVTNLTNGTVWVNGVAANSFTGQQLASGLVSFHHDGTSTLAASFKVSVEDGNEDSSTPTQSTFNFTVGPANLPPTLTGDLSATVVEGGSYTLTTTDIGYTDADDTSTGVTFTVSSLSHGTVLVNGSAATTFTYAQLQSGVVTFEQNGDETGTASFSVSVEDGNEDNSTPTPSTFNFTVTAVNDAPVLTGDLAATISEGGAYQLTSADLGYTDADDIAADVTFTVSNISGVTMTVNGVAATSFTGQQLADGLVSFQHDGGETTTASFKVSVEDGNEDSSTPTQSTFNFTVSAVNDAPVLTGDLTATLAEGGSYTLTSSDLGYTDVDDIATGVTFTISNATYVTVLVNGVAATSFTGQQLTDGLVVIQHNGSETTSASFDVSVDDGNEDASTPTSSTFNLTVTPVNDAPVVNGDLAGTVLEGGSYTLTTTDLNFSDTDDTSSGVTFTVSNLSHGTLLVNGAAATTFTYAQLTGGLVTFTHDGGETTAASFDVSVEDGNEDASTPVASTFNLTVTPVNDAPVLTGDLAAVIIEGGSYELTSSDLGFTDPDDIASGVTFTISNLSGLTMTVNGVAATTFTGQQLIDGLVSVQHDGSDTGTGSFDVSVDDGIEDGSTPSSSTFNFTVNAINDAPVLTGDLAATVAEGGTYTLTSADLGFTDADDTASGVIFTVSDLSGITLKVDGVMATSFTGLQLANGLVSVLHDGSEASAASFKVSVEDGNEDNSTPSESTFNFTVTPVNDAPIVAGDLTATMLEGDTYQLTTTDLNFTDADDTSIGVIFTISNLSHGSLQVSGVAAGSFTFAELQGGLVTFVHDAGEAATASFEVAVEDGDEDGSTPTPSTFNFTITPVNDAPVLGGDLAATIGNGQNYALTSSDLSYTDPDDDPSDVTFTISNLANGKVLVNGVIATSFTGQQLTDGLVTFKHDGSQTTIGSFDVVVEDGNEDSSTPTPSTFNFSVTEINDAPTAISFSHVTNTIAENTNTNSQIKLADIGVTDDNLGTNELSLSGEDAKYFRIVGDTLYLKQDVDLDYEDKKTYNVTVEVNDPTINGNHPELTKNFQLRLTDINEAPEMKLANQVKSLAESASTSSDRRVADIVISDDALGKDELSLSGADAKYFKISGDGLYLRRGVDLDYEDKKTYSVSVELNDPSINGNQPEVTKNFQLKVTDVNEAPKLQLIQVLKSLPENTVLGADRKVADIVVTDDSLGTNKLYLAGDDAWYFRISGGALYLRAGVSLDFETNRHLDVKVRVDDKSIGNSFEDSESLRFNVHDVNDGFDFPGRAKSAAHYEIDTHAEGHAPSALGGSFGESDYLL